MSDIDAVYGETESEVSAVAIRSKAASSVQSSLYRLLEGTSARGKLSWDAIWLARMSDGKDRERRGKNARDRLSRLSRPTLQLLIDACRTVRKKPGKSDEVLQMAADVESAIRALPQFQASPVSGSIAPAADFCGLCGSDVDHGPHTDMSDAEKDVVHAQTALLIAAGMDRQGAAQKAWDDISPLVKPSWPP
jgi:hypothetical protein